jgi:hypothetical protein
MKVFVFGSGDFKIPVRLYNIITCWDSVLESTILKFENCGWQKKGIGRLESEKFMLVIFHMENTSFTLVRA